MTNLFRAGEEEPKKRGMKTLERTRSNVEGDRSRLRRRKTSGDYEPRIEVKLT